VCNNSPAEATSPENGRCCSVEPILDRNRRSGECDAVTSRRAAVIALKVSDVSLPGAVTDADLGGSSKYSSENLED
jgi:hypothetical protein